MEFTQQSTEREWKEIFEIFYKFYKPFKYLPAYGIFLLFIAILLIIQKDYFMASFNGFLGLVSFFNRPINIALSMRRVKSNNFSDQEGIKFFPDGKILVKASGRKEIIRPIQHILHYLEYQNWILLYVNKKQFAFFKISQLREVGIYKIIKSKLAEFNIEQIIN